jgi:sodium transport system permease protein
LKLRPIGIVYRKELRDLMRDFRAIISMIVVPVIIVPVIMLGALKIVKMTMKSEPNIMVLGAEGSPGTVAALRALHKFDFVPASEDFTNLIRTKRIRAAVEIPKDFDAAVDSDRMTSIRIYAYQGEPTSMQIAQQLDEFFRQRRDQTVRRRLAERSLPETVAVPFDVQRENVASPKQVTGSLLGMILPYVLIVMCLTGAIYPSVDLTAGEKERGTLETLLSSPVDRTNLVLGKMLAVLTMSLGTAALAITSNGFAFYFVQRGGMAKLPLELDPAALIGVCIVMIPLAVLLSSVTVAVGLFARSCKEANTYLQPMLLLAILPAIVAALPGVDFNYRAAFLPVVNISLLCKEMLAGTSHWGHILVVFGSTSVYAALTVAAAVKLFKRESVLFRS